MRPVVPIAILVLLVLTFLGASPARGQEPDPLGEFLRLTSITVPVREAGGLFWAFTPSAALVVEGRQLRSRNNRGSAFDGEVTTVASTSLGWVMGTTAGAYEVGLTEGDLRRLPELGEDGIYRFQDDLGFTEANLFRLDIPWERFSYKDFQFEDLNDVWPSGDTLYVATRKGLRRFLWEQRGWDDAPLGEAVEGAHLARFVRPSLLADEGVAAASPLALGERQIFYQKTDRQWEPLSGVTLAAFRRAASDSAFRNVDDLLFADDAQESGGGERRWMVTPTGVLRMEFPSIGAPFASETHRLQGDVRATFEEDSLFVWLATTDDLYVIDRGFQSVDRFFTEDIFVWDFMGRPTEFTVSPTDERGWFCMTSLGPVEVYTQSWEWQPYGTDRFEVDDVTCTAADVDGFWVGTSLGLRWFGADRRQWDQSRVPDQLQATPILKLEWQGSELYALSAEHLYSTTRRSRRWTKVVTLN
jgi:hypothetical protein